MCAQMKWWQSRRCPTVANSLMRWDKIVLYFYNGSNPDHKHFTWSDSTVSHSPFCFYACGHGHITWSQTCLTVVSRGLINRENKHAGLELGTKLKSATLKQGIVAKKSYPFCCMKCSHGLFSPSDSIYMELHYNVWNFYLKNPIKLKVAILKSSMTNVLIFCFVNILIITFVSLL